MIYQAPPGVTLTRIQGRPFLSTPQNGKIALDSKLLAFWQAVDGLQEVEIQTLFPAEKPEVIRAALACLSEAGLLTREGAPVLIVEGIGDPERTGSSALVSVIIVGYNSRDWLGECLPSLLGQTHEPLEVIFVDNASADGTRDAIEQNYPQVKLLPLEAPVSLSRALNLGAAASSGGYLLFLNPDVRLESDAVAQMVSTAQSDPRCAAVAAKLRFWWAPGFLNGLGNIVGPVSWGTDLGLGHLDLGQFDQVSELPSACFAAALVTRPAWEAVGGLDEGFPMYYEDSEWCYRARLLGYTVRAAPQAVVYHAYGGRIPSIEGTRLTPRKLRCVTYGRLRFALKLCGPRLARFLTSYLFMDSLGLAAAALTLKTGAMAARLRGWRDLLRDLPALRQARAELQTRRLIPDRELFRLPEPMPQPVIWRGLPELTWDLVQTQYLPLIQNGKTRPMPEFQTVRPRLLLISNDVVDSKMAGPGLRYFEMARALSPDLDVTLAVPGKTSLEGQGFTISSYDLQNPSAVRELAGQNDILLVSSYLLEKFPFLSQVGKRLAVDLYDPFVLENLYYYRNEPLAAQVSLNQQGIAATNRLAQAGDFFICGNERQRDYWLGLLTANGRLNPHSFAQDDSLRSLLDIVGVGLPEREIRTRPFIRGIHPQVGPDARIVLWGGGIWDWLDPLTLVEAWPQVVVRHPEARLVFLGTRHPNPLVPPHAMAARAEQRVAELGVKDRTILFFDWLSVEDREALLAEADVGVLLHPVHVETRYSIRTRVLDYIWARLPVLITEGDVTSEWIQQYHLGAVVPPADVQAVAESLCALLDRPKGAWAEAFTPLRQAYRWERVVEPLRRYALQGGPAADRGLRRPGASTSSGAGSFRWRWSKAWYLVRREGVKVAVLRLWRYLQWRLSTR